MTREEAIKLLQATRLMLMDGANQPISDLYYALDMAIEALEQTEPTISKMEQVDEPQTYVINPQEPTNDDKCFECDDFFTCGGQCNKIEDEPHTDCHWR